MGTRERKQREMNQRKRLIIEKSKELFFSRDFSSVTIQDICNAIEYGRSAVYNLFKSKEEIYGHIYVEAVRILADLLGTIDVDGTDPEDMFRVATGQVFTFFKDYRPYYNAVFFFDSNHLACRQIPPDLLTAKYAQKERAMSPVRVLLNRGAESGVLKDVDADRIIEVYFASILGIINSFVAENGVEDLDTLSAMLQQHADIYGYGLKA